MDELDDSDDPEDPYMMLLNGQDDKMGSSAIGNGAKMRTAQRVS